MVQINSPIDIVIKALGDQVVASRQYRTLIYTVSVEVDSGLLFYNLMTKELIFLDSNEFQSYKKNDFDAFIMHELIKKWFLVPLDCNDHLIFEQTDNLYRMMSDTIKNPPLKQFVIFPTTDCNARCFYCFELACRRIEMSEQTAHDVATYIAQKANGQNIHIMWFGGEPLYNSMAIDTISNDLKKRNLQYDSEMISNGYLFDKATITKAKTLWKLKKIQITLDGTEDVYNRIKAYIYKDSVSPFKKVKNNIELLLANGIYVSIRLNMDLYNCEDLSLLSRQIVQQFVKYNNWSIYIALLFEKSGKKYTKRSIENKKKLQSKLDELENYLREHNRLREQGVEIYRSAKHCMADNNSSTTILPDGMLGKCEHFTDDNFYGNIYSEKQEKDNIEKFKQLRNYGEKCHKCALQPKCLPLKECPNTEDICDEFDRELKFRYLKRQMIVSYQYKMKYIQSDDLLCQEVEQNSL